MITHFKFRNLYDTLILEDKFREFDLHFESIWT
jgi:hypothetical protein